jgi:GNAT superfamily N-acetyltransferase
VSAWIILPLSEEHDRSRFDCGEASLNDFLKQYARQNEEKGVGRTFVLTREGEQRVLGYYTLAAGEVARDKLPPKAAKKLPKYPVPVVVLGRLAVDLSVQGEKLGRVLLKDALHRVLAVSQQIGCYAVLVRALNTKAAEFYAKFSFEPLPGNPLELYLPLATLQAGDNDAK